jgi:hypothetical protein
MCLVNLEFLALRGESWCTAIRPRSSEGMILELCFQIAGTHSAFRNRGNTVEVMYDYVFMLSFFYFLERDLGGK